MPELGVSAPHEASSFSESARSASSRWLERGLQLLALLLLVPGLRVGAVYDDWVQAYGTHQALGWWRRLFGLYEFFHASEVGAAREAGLLPWWADDGLSISFLRPISSLLLAADHLLLDGGGIWSHLHALVWYGLTVWAARRVLVLLFGVAEARWGTLLFALSSCHVLPLAFMASLHAHVTAVFALFSFECLVRVLQLGERRKAFWSVFWFVLALAGGESALVLVPIALAYGVVEGGWRRAFSLLAPHAAVTLLFLGVYFGLGYGSHHSGGYLQPGTAEFFREFPLRWLVYVAGLLTGFPPDLWLFGAQPLQVAIGVAALPIGALALHAVLRAAQPALEPRAARRLWVLCLGALLALLPVTTGIPGGRLLVLPSLFIAALFGMAARRAAGAWRQGNALRALLLGGWVALFGVGLHPLFRVLVPAEMARLGKELPEVARGIGERCRGMTALVAGMPDSNADYVGSLFLGRPESERPKALHTLDMAPGKHRLVQTDRERFELTIEGDFFALNWPRIYRDAPLPPALKRQLQGVEVEVLEASAVSTRLALHVGEGERTCWLTLEKGDFVPLYPTSGRALEWTPSLRPR